MVASWIRPHLRPSLVSVRPSLDGQRKPNLPITEHTNQHLSDNNTNDFHVVNSFNPNLVAYFICAPATLEDGLEHRFDIAN